MATDLRFPPMRVSLSASSLPASHRYLRPASDWLAHSPAGEGGEKPLSHPPLQPLLLFYQLPSPSLVTTATQPSWIEKRTFSKAPQRTLTSAPGQQGCG